jgi:NAD(P)-dependent dehydrogenase (short-subunit alcohol dehydrogenase family)
MQVLQGKVAVITGGNSGIGLATAKRVVEEGGSFLLLQDAGDRSWIKPSTTSERMLQA